MPLLQHQLAARDESSVAPAARPGEGGSAALRPPSDLGGRQDFCGRYIYCFAQLVNSAISVLSLNGCTAAKLTMWVKTLLEVDSARSG